MLLKAKSYSNTKLQMIDLYQNVMHLQSLSNWTQVAPGYYPVVVEKSGRRARKRLTQLTN